MSLSDDHLSSTGKNRARTSQESRESPQGSSFLRSKETETSLSDDPPPPRKKNRALTSQEPRESPQDSSFLRSKETEKKSQTSMGQETEKPFVSPINTDEEVFKGYESYRENPDYYDSDKILINTENTLNPYGDMFEGSLDSAGYIGSQNDHDALEMPRLTLHNSGSQIGVGLIRPDMEQEFSTEMQGEGYGTNTCGPCENKIDIAAGSVGNIESLMNAEREKEKIVMIPTPGFVDNSGSQIGVIGLIRPDMEQEFSTEMQGEGYGTHTCGPLENKIDIAVGSFGNVGSIMNAEREKEKTVMIPTPRFVEAPQWTIKKKLTQYDTNPHYDRLILQKSSFDEHIGRHLPKADYQKVVDKIGTTTVNVYDYDTDTMHELRLELEKSYGLRSGWLEHFVRRRCLRQNEEIGLLWDSSASRIQFGVISRRTRRKRQTYK
ncbi:unnamed protein product [Arabidopsis lyrata]|uniref:Uncharacterized protein n=1 Tax=Arabidopsis lyrata subsp. lyrata TaxID=81972 RepID=D7M3C2_ARALL|nr:B3 domain-containing protein At4g02870 isoform X1 [Arabidopsis lyrata subsp. lyrata]EFH49065.1 hypothetical protein ARALYDRAFT_352538 [Arabidopsis lyrata subsp. lyrata]CAH8273353.1 unnamed protein product [Arabidopsis lyrata]|eukprot:XP_002872806.1 B3 domain-containing protein At4g02870 isoform X1 [Arabidopsis lyrata subsp. lyrata]